MLTREEAIKKHYDIKCHIAESKKILSIINQIYDDHEVQMKAKDEEIDKLFGLIKSLWQIIDDIDTYGDIAKSDDAFFRSLVEKKQKERWKLPITSAMIFM